MESTNDEEIQRLIEEQLKGNRFHDNTEDKEANLYQLLFTELVKEPLEIKDGQLAENVVGQILTKQERREKINYGLVIVGLVSLVFGLSYFTMARVDNATLNTLIHFLIANKIILFFIFFTFCLIEILDKRLVKRNIL